MWLSIRNFAFFRSTNHSFSIISLVNAKYANGIVYDYSDGQPVNAYLMLSDEFLNEMSRKLARLHSLAFKLPAMQFETHFHKMSAPGQMNEMQRQQ